MGRFLSFTTAFLTATTFSSVLAAPVLIYCEEASHIVPGDHPPCTTVTPSQLLEIPLPIQTSILMAFAPNMQFGPPHPAKERPEAPSRTEENLPSFPSTLMPLLDFLESGPDPASHPALSDPPHDPLPEGPTPTNDEGAIFVSKSSKKDVLHYLVHDYTTIPLRYAVLAFVCVTLLAFLLAEACERCRLRLARYRRRSCCLKMEAGHHEEKAKV